MADKSSLAEPTPTPAAPSRDSVLTLREITEANWRQVTNLRTLDQQAGNLASNAMSMLEGFYTEGSWFRALYADSETLVGFLMMGLWHMKQEFYLWRFMIDQRYQGLGFGRQGVQLAIAHVRASFPQAKLLRCFSTPPEGKYNVTAEFSPFKFYEYLGFKQIEPPDEDGEIEMALEL